MPTFEFLFAWERMCYFCIADGVNNNVEYLDGATVTLDVADYVGCMSTPAEIN